MKRLLVLVLAAFLILSPALKSSAAGNGNPFTDVAEGQNYYEAVVWAYNAEPRVLEGITPTKFKPFNQCNRAQVVTFLWRMKGCPEPELAEESFEDVSEKDFFYKPVLWALENEIVAGKTATRFGATDVCTRAQFVTFLWRAEGKQEPKLTVSPFTDIDSSKGYCNAVLWAYEHGITMGKDALHFAPNTTINRAQTVMFLYRYSSYEEQGGDVTVDPNLIITCVPDYTAEEIVKVSLTDGNNDVDGIQYDAANNMLILNGYDGGPVFINYNNKDVSTAALYGLKIRVIGINKIHATPNYRSVEFVNTTFDMYRLDALIDGDGSLVVENRFKDDTDGHTISILGNLTIDGPNVIIGDTACGITVEEAYYSGFDAEKLDYVTKTLGGNLTIKNSRINIMMRPHMYETPGVKKTINYISNAAIYAKNDINISGGEFVFDMKWMPYEEGTDSIKFPEAAIYAENTLSVNNATINLTMDRIMEDVPCFKAKDNDHIKAGGSLVSIFLR